MFIWDYEIIDKAKKEVILTVARCINGCMYTIKLTCTNVPECLFYLKHYEHIEEESFVLAARIAS